MENVHQKLVPDPSLILVNKPKQPLILLKIRCFERELSKSLNKLTSFVVLKPVPFNGLNYQKQKGPGTIGQLLFRLRNKIVKFPLLAMCYLTRCNDVLELFQKLHLQIMQANS